MGFGRFHQRRGLRRAGAWSVRTYVVLIMSIAGAAIVAACGYGFAWSTSQARAAAIDRLSFETEQAASAISTALATARTTVAQLAAQPGVEQVVTHPAGCTLTADGLSPFTSVRVDLVRSDGSVACSSKAAAVAATQEGKAWPHQVLARTGTTIVWDAVDPVSGEDSVVAVTPLRSGATTVGAALAVLHLPQVAGTLTRDRGGPAPASFLIVDERSGRVISSSAAGDRPAQPARLTQHAPSGQWTGLDGVSRLYGSHPVAGSSWRVYAGVPASTVLDDARGTLVREAVIAAVAAIALAIGALLLNRRVARPLRALTEAVVRARSDPESVRASQAGAAELATLAREVNVMLDVRNGHEAQLLHAVTHDPLTGLANGQLLRQRTSEALRSTSPTSVALLCVALTRLDAVNEALGREVGDRLLVEVADRLTALLRVGDTLCRSGNQFYLLRPGDDLAHARVLAEAVRRNLAKPFAGPTAEITLHPAIGVTATNDPGHGGDQLLREADSAARQAKASGRGWAMYDPTVPSGAVHRMQVEHELQRALTQRELVVHYQPVVDVASGDIMGAEALVRWQHPERGMVPPAEFIPVAEESGQIAAIGRHVLAVACRQAAAWADAGCPLQISVNVAVQQLRLDDFPSVVDQTLADTGLAPQQLCLEITESSLIREIGADGIDLARLSWLGVQLAIDDFGTGYSSLAYLHQLPVNELKIDRSFVSRLDADPRNRHLVDAIMGMARALGLVVVAEGVESSSQLEVLTALGCPRIQGYLFSAPLPVERFSTMLRLDRQARATVRN